MKTRLTALLTGVLLLFGSLVATTSVAAAQEPYGTKILNASDWLGGGGVDVYSNGNSSYVSNDYSAPAVGMKWQCVELPQRLYKAKGWHSGMFANVGVAADIWGQAGNLGMSTQANGSISSIVPGDMIIHSYGFFGGAGHVALVDSVSGSTINVVEQNFSSTGRAMYSLSGGSLSRSGAGSISGVVHDPDNTSSGSGGGALTTTVAISVGPSNNVSLYTPLNWSYRVKNTSGVAASIQRFVVAVRGPGNNPLDVQCGGGNGVTLQPNQEWTCDAQLSTGYGQAGQFIFWADWLDFSGNWHKGQLSGDMTLTVSNGATLYPVQPISVGPSDYRPMLTPLYWSYRVRNTSSSYASIQRFVVAVRGPGNNPLDVQCLNGTNVTLAPQQEWTCDAQLSTGYGQAGQFIFWADWLGYDGSWHHGQLGADKLLTLY